MSSEPSKLGNTARLLFAACVGACLNEAIQLASHQPRLSLLWLTLLGAFAWRQWSGSSLQKEQEPEQEQERASAGGQRQPVKAAVQELRRLFWSLKGVTQQRLWAALVALIIAGHSGCMIYKGSYCLFALLMEVGIVGCSMYLLGQQKSAETMKAIANEAAVRLVALHRQNEGLADEKEELEAELKSIAQQKQSALHAGSPADLILEVLDLMLEGGVPRADDLLLLRDFILSGSHHHDMYQPLDVWQQLHTLTMEPDVEEALCYQLLGRAPSKEVSPAFYSMPENNGLSSDALLDPKNNPLRSCFSDQLPPSFLSEAHSGQEGTGQEGLSAEDGLRNMLAAIACDNSILEVRRSPNHIASNSSLLQKLSVRGGNSSFTEQAQMVLGPEKLPSQKSSISSHLDRLQTIGRVGSDGSAASNKSCPPQLVGSLNGGASSGINREGSNNWSSFGTAGVLGFPTAAAAAATAQRRGSGEHSDLPVSPTLPLHRRRDKLRTLSALMQAPGGTGPPLRNPRARSSCSLGLGLQQAQEQQQQQQASAHISGGSQPPSTVHSPSNSPFPSSSYCRRPPRPSHSMSNLNSKQQVERKPAQQHPSVEMADTETANKEAVGPNFPTLLSRKSKTQPDLMGSSQLLPRQQPSPRPPDFSKLSHTTAESSSTFQSRSQKAWSTHTSHSDCLLPSFPLNASSSEVAARRGSLPFLHPHGMPRHPAGSSGSLSRRLSQLSMCQPLSGLLSEGRRASQQSMYHPSSGALSDSRKVLSEEAVCKDLMLAAQCSERHVLDEVEEAAAEQLYAGSSRSTLPGHQAPSPEQIGAGFEQGADHLMVVGPRSGSSSVVSGPPRPPSLHISSPFSDQQALAAPKPPDTAPTPPRASMEAPAFPLPTGSFLCGQEQEQLQLMLQSRQPSSRLPSKSSSRSMPTLADLLCRKKPAPNRGLRGREEEEEEKEEEEEEEVEQEEQQLGLGNLVQVPPCANSARASRVAAAELKHTPTADQASSFISNSKQKSESSCSSKGEDVKLDVRGSASQPRRGSQCTDTESVVSAPGSRRSGTSSSARQWVLGLLEGGSNSRRRPRAAQTFSEKSPSLEPMVSPSSKPASKAKKGPLQQLFGNMKGRGKSLKNKDAEKCPANSTAAKEGSERSTPAAPSSTASEASHVGSLQDARKGILGSQGSAPAESLDAIAASVIGLGTLDAPSASTHAARIHDAGGAVGGGSLPAGPFAAASAQAVAPVGPPPTAPADAAPAAPTPTAPAAAAAVAAAEPQGCEPQVCVPQSECAEAPIPPPAACSSRGSPSSGHGSVVISGNIGSSGRVGTKRVQGPLSLTELAVEVNAATDETRASPSSTAAAAAAGASKVPASSSSRGEPGWLDNDQQQSTTVEMNEDSEILRQKELMQPGLAPGRRGGAVRARGSSVLSFEGSSRHSSTFPLEPVSSSTSLFTGSALPSKTLQSGVQTLQSDHALAPKPSNYVTASARGPPQASQSNVFRRGSMEQGSLSSFLPQVPEDTQPFIHAPVNRQPTGRSSDGEAFGSTMMFVTQDGLASKSLPAPSLHVAPESAATSKLTSPSPPTAAASTSVSRVRGGSATDTSVGGQNVCEGRLPPGAAAEGSEEGSLKAGVGVRRALQQQQQQQQQQVQQQQVLGPRSAPVLEMERMLEESYESWSFDAFKLAAVTQGHPLSALAYYLFHKNKLISTFDLPPVKLARFLRSIEAGYTTHNPYHNATHAADVLQTLHVIIRRGAMVPQFADCLSVMAALLAAIMHDYEHMGLTNDFLVNNSSPLAIRYNDRAPLENHHLAAGFTVLHSRDHNFLDGLPKAEYSRLRKIVIDLVLATDMKQHFALVGQFNAVVRRVMPRAKPQDPGPSPNSPRARTSAFGHSRDKPMGRALSTNLSVLLDSQNLSVRRHPAASTPVSGEMFPSIPHRNSMDVTESALSQLKAATQDASARIELLTPRSTGRSIAASLPSFRDRSTGGEITSADRMTMGDRSTHGECTPSGDHTTSGENSIQGRDRHTGGSEGPVRGSSTSGNRESPSSLDESQKLLLLQIALKCADLGHVAEDHDVHIRWVHALEEEFYRQGDREKAAKLPVSPLFDRDKPGVTKSQVGFFDVVVLPLLQAFTTAVPGALPVLEKAERNYWFWKAPIVGSEHPRG